MDAPHGPFLPAPVAAHFKSSGASPFFAEKYYTRPQRPFSTRPGFYNTSPSYDPDDKASRLARPFVVSITDIFIAALQALSCLLYLVTGHAILRAAHHGYAAPISSSAVAGALGGAVFTVPAILLCACRREGLLFVLLYVAVETTIGALAGSVGVTILKSHIHGELLNPLHAARAGALGAVILNVSLQVLNKLMG
jgi:hypothetical protein